MPAHRSLPFEARNMVSQTSRSSRSISASLWAMAGSCPVHCLINAQAARYSLSRGTRYASPSYLAFRAHSRSVFSTPRTQAEILKTLVQQGIAEALATRDEFFFEPWFRSRQVSYEIKRLQTVPERKKWALFFGHHDCCPVTSGTSLTPRMACVTCATDRYSASSRRSSPN